MAELDDLLDSRLGPATQPAPPADLDSLLDIRLGQVRNPSTAESVKQIEAGIRPGEWGAGSQLLEGLSLGAYEPALRAITGRDVAVERKRYHEYAPLQGDLLEGLGGLTTSAALMMLGAEGAGAARAAIPLGRIGGALADFLAGQSTGVARIPSLAARGATEGAAAGALESGLSDRPLGEQIERGALTGSVVNPAVAGVVSKLGSKLSPETVDIARGMERSAPEAAPRAGQLPGASPIVQMLDKLFSSGKNAGQREAFNNALTSRANLPSERINQKWVADADALNGGMMTRIAQAHDLDGNSPQLRGELRQLYSDAQGALDRDSFKKFKDVLGTMGKDLNRGAVPGTVYQNWTGKTGIIQTNAKDPKLQPFMKQLRNSIDDEWERSIYASGTPQDAELWSRARSGYRLTRVIDDAYDEKGEFNPQKLLPAIQSNYKNAQNAGQAGEIARGGTYLYPPEKAPAQGTMAKAVGHGTAGMTGMLGALAAEHAPGLLHHLQEAGTAEGTVAALGGLGGIGAAKAANALTSSPLYRRHLLDLAEGGRRWTGAGNLLIPPATYLENRPEQK